VLKAFTDLAGAVITAGVLHTQSDTAQAITGRHAGYVMTVKAGMPALCRQLKKRPWTAIPATSAVSTGRGRRARRTVTREGKKAAGVVYLIASGRDARGLQRTLSCFRLHERLCRVPGGWPAAVRSPLRGPAAPETGTAGLAAVVEGHLVAVGVGERESAAERPVDGR
jgi:hypothetical protein